MTSVDVAMQQLILADPAGDAMPDGEATEALLRRFLDGTVPAVERSMPVVGRRNHPRWLIAAVSVLGLLLASTIALAASGVILTGKPVHPEELLNPNLGEGIPAPGASHLLSLRVPDPAGGLPWGMRIVRTTRGEVCVQIGRVQGDQLGELGIDGAFHDDGRFHPIPANALPRDVFHGRVFDSLLGTATTSCHLAGSAVAGVHIGVYPSAAAHSPVGKGSKRELRDLIYGILGPQAVSVGYREGPHDQAHPVLAPIGAYLLVRVTGHGQQVGYGDESLGTEGQLAPSPPLRTITYRLNGKLCQRGLSEPLGVTDHLVDPCPQVRYPTKPTPVRDLHQPLQVHLLIRHHLVIAAQVSFRAPFAVTSARQHYTIVFPRVPCRPQPRGVYSGGSEAIARNSQRGARITWRLTDPFAGVCAGYPARLEVRYGSFPYAYTIVASAVVPAPPGSHFPPLPRRRQSKMVAPRSNTKP
jgi:hypothetical protein